MASELDLDAIEARAKAALKFDGPADDFEGAAWASVQDVPAPRPGLGIGFREEHLVSDRPSYCCGVCPPTARGGYDCTCRGNPSCPKSVEAATAPIAPYTDEALYGRKGERDA